jgi:hypothetical protein
MIHSYAAMHCHTGAALFVRRTSDAAEILHRPRTIQENP